MNCRSIPERDDWFLTDRKPTICPRCNKKEVRKAVLGYPTEEDFNNDNIYLIGCQCLYDHHLSAFKHCHTLDLSGTPHIRDLTHLKHIPELYLDDCHDIVSMEGLIGGSNKKISMANCRSLSILADMSHIEYLDLSRCRNIQNNLQ